ncbi:DEAD/DEAH box helicase [Lacisediminihabitans sp. FW035]
MTLELFQFQQIAASQIADRYEDYAADPVSFGRKANSRLVPFYQALSSITGSGKTAILAQAVSEIVALSDVPPVILWLSKGKVVVQQTFANLTDGGKYNHLLTGATVRLLSDYKPQDVANSTEALLYFATVGTFNQRDRAKSNLKIFAQDTDITETTLWEALKVRETAEGVRRPLIVVYDEAQNLSDQQTDLLLEQQPNAFLLASATLRFPDRFNTEVIEPLRTQGEFSDEELITSIPSAVVVASGLVKGIISLDGLLAPMQETISEMLSDLKDAEQDAINEGLSFLPKAIYVCNTNMVADDAGRSDDPKQVFTERQAPPIVIWRYLTESCGISPDDIAVYADLKTQKDFPLPPTFNLFNGGEGDYDAFIAGDFRHIIFNQSLQEGWDDPATYFAYVDKSMDSSIQITQIVGRVLRQPGATHYEADRLNTAHFYVRVDRNDAFADVVEDVRKGLGGDAPEIRILTTAPGGERPVSLPAKEQRSVPKTAIDNLPAKAAVETVINGMHDYTSDTVNTKGVGRRRTVQQTIGEKETVDSEWVEFEQSNKVNARWVFRREVSRRYRPALMVMNTETSKFDAKVGVGSVAYTSTTDDAAKAVDEYLRNAVVKQVKPNPYEVGSTLVRPSAVETYTNALHDGYDGLNDFEKKFARALDDTGLLWSRNRSQTGYKIPLISLGQTVWFFPDFLVWVDDKVICIDTKGEQLVETDSRRKLLSIAPHPKVSTRVEVKFVTSGTWKTDGTPDSKDGYSIWGLGSGQALRTLPFDDLPSLVTSFIPVEIEADEED